MKILFINCTYWQGSTGKIVADLVKTLRSLGHETIVAYGGSRLKGSFREDLHIHQVGYKLEGRLHILFTKMGVVMQYGGMLFSYLKLKKIIVRENPDVVHVHCINGCTTNIFRVISFLGNRNIPTVVTHHAEFYYTGSCAHAFDCVGFISKECKGCPSLRESTGTSIVNYAHKSWKRMKESFECFNDNNLIFTAVSPWVLSRSTMSPIVNRFRCFVVKNGVDTEVFTYSPSRDFVARRVIGLKSKVVLHVTGVFYPDERSHPKGGWFIIEMARRFPSTTFLIVATTSQVLGELPSNVFVWGNVLDQRELAMLYSSADVTIVASRRETFSMVVAESLCCGTPVVGFEAGGPESIALSDFSKFVSYGDVDGLEKSVSFFINNTVDRTEVCKQAILEYDNSKMISNYLNVYGLLSKRE